MIGRRICTIRKLVLLSLATALSFFLLMIRNETNFKGHHHLRLSTKDDGFDEENIVSPRYFASSSSLSMSPSVDINLGVNLNDGELVRQLKSMGIAINSDPLEARLQVHPSMSVKDAEDVFHRFVAELHIECTRHVRVGNITDGGWDMCIAGPYQPTSDGSCLVYSFGIGDNWSFDDDMAKRFGCTVHSFDPSMNVSDHQRSERISFHRIGIGSQNTTSVNGWRLMPLADIVSMCHDDGRVIDYLKIDVESNEWDALEEILSHGKILSHVKQLAIEIHTKELNKIQSTKEDLYRYWTILHGLEVAGFRRWYWHFNLWGFFPSRTLEKYLSCCYETIYININFLPK